MVLTMTKVEFPQNWIGKKRIQIKAENHAYIRSIWQAGDEKIHKIHESKSCVKNNITEIYEVALKEPKQNKETTRCLNGGFPDKYNSTCVCDPCKPLQGSPVKWPVGEILMVRNVPNYAQVQVQNVKE
uniref:Uncharacterized protein n=1 Tax=Cacopsylla melanoneura TaxID=428564 RepID=A0A8D8XXH6_9HEMI